MGDLKFVPIWEKDGNRFFVCLTDFVADNKDDAWKISLGASLVEGVILGMKRTDEILEISQGIPHYKATIADFPVGIISGPLFEKMNG